MNSCYVHPVVELTFTATPSEPYLQFGGTRYTIQDSVVFQLEPVTSNGLLSDISSSNRTWSKTSTMQVGTIARGGGCVAPSQFGCKHLSKQPAEVAQSCMMVLKLCAAGHSRTSMCLSSEVRKASKSSMMFLTSSLLRLFVRFAL
eukprot:6483857-Amphidinium_carterae.1